MGEAIPQLDDGWHAGVVDEHIQHLAAQSLLDGLLGIAATAVDAMGGAHLLSELEAAVKTIDSNDRSGGDQGRRLNDVQANAAGPEHHNGFAHLELGVVLNYAKTCGDSATEQSSRIRIGA